MSDKPGKVQLFHTCIVNEFYPEAGISVVNVLEHLGLTVEVPRGQTCCGQPAYNSGYRDDAKKAARHTVELLFKTEGHIIIPSGSCADMIVHQYPLLFADEAPILHKVKQVIGRCYEFSQFIVDVLGVTATGAQLNSRAAYHPSCHLVRGLGVINQPVSLLNGVGGLETVDFSGQDECCGFGGTFSVKEPEISGAMMKKKIDAIEAAGADIIVGCDLGCLMHLEGGLHRKGSPIKVRHIAQILDTGLR
ncbi:(Fe-S)-binding protein [candidate division KSB1 bacterium]